jgi:CubicO group peptidase (beta-lactamase class C family)
VSRRIAALAAFASLPLLAAAQSAPPPGAPAPTLEQRLARLCDDVEQLRAQLHISGLSLAVVKDDQVVLARGFGVRDREKKLACDENTLYGVGSTSKAFTSMLVAMLADEGKISFHERPAKYLPWFKFKDPYADEHATLRDLMAHRTGLTRTDVAWLAAPATREQLLRNIAVTEPNAPFWGAPAGARGPARWQYNNAMFLCAGECAAAVAGKGWDELVRTRIFDPLGMKHSGTTAAFARADADFSKGYDWDDKKGDFEVTPFVDVDNMAPAGAIVSTVSDMARWVRFLLARGEFEGKRLVEAREFEELWSDDDDLVPNYGQGWFLHPGDAEIAAHKRDPKSQAMNEDAQCWRAPDGKRHLVVEHGGNVPGFSAEVGLLPEYRLGLVMLSNVSASQLQASILDLVWNAVLGSWKERRKIDEGAPLTEAATKPWLGAYSEGRVGVPPRALQRVADRLVLILPPALGQVAVATYTLSWPAADGRFWLREESDAYLTIDRDDKGGVQSLTLVRNGDSFRMTPLPTAAPPTPPEQSVEELEAARLAALDADKAGGVKSIRLTGTMSYPQAGTTGRYVLVAQGPDRLRIDYDVGPFGHATTVVDGRRGWQENHFGGFKVLGAPECAGLLLRNPFVESGSWIDHAEECEVVGLVMASALGLPLPSDPSIPSVPGLPPRPAPHEQWRVKPEGGDAVNFYVLPTSHLPTQVEGPHSFPGVPNSLPFARVTLKDAGNGWKIVVRREASEPQIGDLRLQIDQIELDAVLPADAFAIREARADAKSGS